MSQAAREKIAKNVEALRLARKLTREQLSIRLSFDSSYISKLEKGEVNITIDRLAKIAEYFCVELLELLK